MDTFRIHFWSSTEYAGFLAGLMRELNAQPGVEAAQRFTISEASYRSAHSKWARKWLRIQQYIIYPIHLFLSLVFGQRADVVVVCTNTFFAPLLASFLHRRVVHLVYDLYPEALVHAGKMSGKSTAAAIIHRLTQKTFQRVEANVFLGKRLKEYADGRYVLGSNNVVIAVGADDNLFPEEPISAVSGPDLTVLYCGNLGYMHDVDTVFSAWEAITGLHCGIRWQFQSVGPRHGELLKKVEQLKTAELDIQVGPGLAQNEWIRVMKSSPIALVTMVPGSEEVVMPSKSYSALAAGQAILAVAPEQSDLVAMIVEHQCGWWVEPGDVQGLVTLIQAIAADPEKVQQYRLNAKTAAREQYSQRALAGQWLRLIGWRHPG